MESVNIMEWIVLLVISLIGIALTFGIFGVWIWAIVDCVKNESSDGNDKLVWILIIVFTHLLGALLYLLIRRPQRIRELGH
jgi:H+/Cl- antiporter ClcA